MNQRSKKLLCIGECMVEMSPRGGGMFQQGFAGDVFNTAWYARKLLAGDWTVAFYSAIGQDSISNRFADFAASNGIETATIRRLPNHTMGLYLIELDNGERSFSYWRGQSAARQLASDPDHLETAVSSSDLAYFSGITLAVLPEQDRETLIRILGQARASGAQVAFDPNIRPRLWRNTTEMHHWIQAGAQVADIVLPSFEDEQTHFGDADPTSTAMRYHALNKGLVVVKNGAADVTCLRKLGETLIHIPVQPVQDVRDTTAAGDSFNAAFLSHQAAGKGLEESVIFASKHAAKVIQHHGALM